MTRRLLGDWVSLQGIPPRRFTCGHCGEDVAPATGYYTTGQAPGLIFICHVCNRPTFIDGNEQVPGAPYGEEVAHLPFDVEALYREAKNCMSVSSYSGAVLLCRKILMNVAVNKGAPENKPFIHYVKYLADNNYIPPNASGWVDHIRNKGNEANHEIHLMSSDDAKELISFTEMLLKIIYEFPSRVPAPPPAP